MVFYRFRETLISKGGPRGTLLNTAVRTTVYRDSIKLHVTVIVKLSAAMGIHLIDMPISHGV